MEKGKGKARVDTRFFRYICRYVGVCTGHMNTRILKHTQASCVYVHVILHNTCPGYTAQHTHAHTHTCTHTHTHCAGITQCATVCTHVRTVNSSDSTYMYFSLPYALLQCDQGGGEGGGRDRGERKER